MPVVVLRVDALPRTAQHPQHGRSVGISRRSREEIEEAFHQLGDGGPSLLEARSAAALFAAVLAVSSAAIVVRLYRVALPRCRRLKALVGQYRSSRSPRRTAGPRTSWSSRRTID